MEFTLNVFTLNCWGIPFVSKNRKERFQAISDYLLQSSHNIVCLQEVWSEKDYLFLKENLKAILPFSYYFYSGVLGSGLCVFSKWLMQDVFFHQWPLNGYIHKIHHGDWFGGKGVGLCRIKLGDRIVNVYCTHLHAEYHEDDMYLAHRVLQAYSTAEFVKLTAATADVCILAGDLNSAPGDISFKIISQLPSLVDPFDMKCLSSNVAITKASGTSENANNSYSDVKVAQTCPEGKRIDHILFRVNTSWKPEIVNFGNPLQDRVPGKSFSYSDHNAVALEMRFKLIENKNLRQDSKDQSLQETITQAIKICQEAMITIRKSKRLFLTIGGLIFMFLLGTVGYWPNFVLYDVIKLVITGLCFYYLMMGTIWNRIEMNSLKAGLTALENLSKIRIENYDCGIDDEKEGVQPIDVTELQ